MKINDVVHCDALLAHLPAGWLITSIDWPTGYAWLTPFTKRGAVQARVPMDDCTPIVPANGEGAVQALVQAIEGERWAGAGVHLNMGHLTTAQFAILFLSAINDQGYVVVQADAYRELRRALGEAVRS